MAEVKIIEGETIDRALKRFRKECVKHGIIAELKKRQHYEKPSERRKKKKLAAIRKALRESSEET